MNRVGSSSVVRYDRVLIKRFEGENKTKDTRCGKVEMKQNTTEFEQGGVRLWQGCGCVGWWDPTCSDLRTAFYTFSRMADQQRRT